jgi:hypothetical protein
MWGGNGVQRITVSLRTQRGSSTPKALKIGKDITVISKLLISGTLTPGEPDGFIYCGVYRGVPLALGDVVTLDYEALDIDVTLRVVGKSYDPYNPNRVSVEIGNYINSLEDDLTCRDHHRCQRQVVQRRPDRPGVRL